MKPIPLSWVNPTLNTDGSAYDAVTENAGYTVRVDGTGAVSIPLSFGTNFDLATLAVVQALKAGPHQAALAVSNKDGEVSAFSADVTFRVIGIPNPPTNLTVG